MSEYFVWDPSRYELGVPAMDHEHQTLITLMNTVHALHDAAAPRAAQAKALEELVNYTRKHFADEEAYMRRIGFPQEKSHAAIHRQLLTRLSDFTTEFARSGTLTNDFFVFLTMWLRAHICGIDAKYVGKQSAA